jgi:hypothetical protein
VKKDYNNWTKLTIHFTASVDVDVTEEFLEYLSAPFGAIGDTIIRSHNRQQIPSFSIHGYGVVFYYDANAASNAMEALQGKVVNNIHLRTSLSPKITGEYMRNATAAHVMGNSLAMGGGLNQGGRALVSPRVNNSLGSKLGLGITTASASNSAFTGLRDFSETIGQGSSSNFDVLGVSKGEGFGLNESEGITTSVSPRAAGLSSLLPANHPGLTLSISTTGTSNTNNMNSNNSLLNSGGIVGDNVSFLGSAAPSDRSVLTNIYDPYQSYPASRTTTPRNANTFPYQENNGRQSTGSSLVANYTGNSSYVGVGGVSSQNASNGGTPVARFPESFSSGMNGPIGGNPTSSSSPQVSLTLSELSLTDDRADLLYQQTRMSPAQNSGGKTASATSRMLSRNPGLLDAVPSTSPFMRPASLSLNSGIGLSLNGGDIFDGSLSGIANISGNGTAGQSEAEQQQYFLYMNRQRSLSHHNHHHHLMLASHTSPSSSRGSSPRNLNLMNPGQLHIQQMLQAQQQLQHHHHQQQQHQGTSSPSLPPLPPPPPSTASPATGSPVSHAAYLRQKQQQQQQQLQQQQYQQAWLQQQQLQQQYQQQQQSLNRSNLSQATSTGSVISTGIDFNATSAQDLSNVF